MLSLVIVGSVLPVAVATAAPQPSAAEIQRRLDQLNRQADQLVDQFNQAQVNLAAARARVKSIERQLQGDRRRFDDLRTQMAQMAAAAYQSGDINSVAMLLSADDPQAILDQAASINQISRNRAAAMNEFLATARQLEGEQAAAKQGADAAQQAADRLQERKARVEQIITQQRQLLQQLPPVARPQRPAPTTPPSSSPSPPPSNPPTGRDSTGSASGSARTAVSYAYAQIGKPYCWGGTGPSCFDCSGLTMMAWRAAGVNLPRTTYDQVNAGRRVSTSTMQAGDLLFFGPGHVGLYVGAGKMIHAPQTGDFVREVSLGSYEQPTAVVRP